MRRWFLTVVLPLLAVAAWAEPDAEYRKRLTKVEVLSQSDFVVTIHDEVVIYKEAQSYLANYYDVLGTDESVSKFSCAVQSLDGRLMKKYKGGDMERTRYSEHLADDVEKVFLNIDLPSYPAVVTTDVTIRHNGNTLGYPPFVPVAAYDVGVKEACYEITYPAPLAVNYAIQGALPAPEVSTTPQGRKTIAFKVGDVPPLSRESHAKPLGKLVPKVYFAPGTLDYYGTKASLESWETFGKWVHGLCDGLDVLPDEAKAKVHSLTDSCKSEWSKIKVLYDFLRQSTRYVSIQLGIGGYRPLSAAFVWKNGFGDCKALANYMKAVLAEAGVSSTYTLVSTTYDKLAPVPNFQQLNHVVLKIPLGGRDVWMECTNPRIPLGYTHEGIAGHDAVEITAAGGKVVTLPDCPDSLNLRSTEVSLNLLPGSGMADVRINDNYYMHSYARMAGWAYEGEREQQDLAGALYDMPFAEVKEAKCQVHDSITPRTKITVASRAQVARTTGSRLFVKPNLLHKDFAKESISGNRGQEVWFGRGMKSIERITLALPDSVSIESLPKDVCVDNEMGVFSSKTSVSGRTIVTTNMFMLRRGTYPKDKAVLFDNLQEARSKAYAANVVLRR